MQILYLKQRVQTSGQSKAATGPVRYTGRAFFLQSPAAKLSIIVEVHNNEEKEKLSLDIIRIVHCDICRDMVAML